MVTVSFNEIVLAFIIVLAVVLVTFYLRLKPKQK